MASKQQRTIGLVTGVQEAEAFTEFLLRQSPNLVIHHIQSQSELASYVGKANGHIRLLAFLTDLIVPAWILNQLKVTPYNIHPGPPEYPGSNPISFALWDEASDYGVTAHEMVARVDAGKIVSVKRFHLDPNLSRADAGDLAYSHAVLLFSEIASHCAHTDEPLPVLNQLWASKKNTQKSFRLLCQDETCDSDVLREKRRRICGDDFVLASNQPAMRSISSSEISKFA